MKDLDDNTLETLRRIGDAKRKDLTEHEPDQPVRRPNPSAAPNELAFLSRIFSFFAFLVSLWPRRR